ncbi:hypothetical protein [Acinetobacter seifertii]|uniref:hypothetical protein n=1 Tax=Acinetobacter seifertii TaxID=1530123 RepID=UPI0032B59308
MYVFEKLKSIIVKLDSLLNSKLFEEDYNTLKEFFSQFKKSNEYIDYNSYDHRIDNNNFRYFIYDFYFFVNRLFKHVDYYKKLNSSALKVAANSILNELYSINDFYGMGSSKSDNNKTYERVVLLEEELKKLSKKVDSNSILIKSTVDGFILSNEQDYKHQLNTLLDGLRSSLSDIHTTYENEIKGKVESLGHSVKKTNEDFQSTYDDYQILKKLVQAKGEQQVTDHYKKKALWERITYWVMTIGTFGIIIWSICLALNGLDEYKAKTNLSISAMVQQYKDQPVEKIEKIYSVVQNNALTYLVLRLIFSVLLFSSIIYTSRVAYRAYVHMRHSENMMLKLATLRPFINQLKEDERNQIHKDLVPDYFGKDAGLVDIANEKFKDLPANVSAVAMKAIEQISGSGSSSSKEKNNKKPESETG